MSGFIDHLLDPQATGKKGREIIQYRDRLRAVINEAPAVRRLPPHEFPYLTIAVPATEQILPTTELVTLQVGETARAESFRDWKRLNSSCPVFRLDPIQSEEQVLETRAMGADGFMINVAWLDLPMLQFLVEVGRDYGLPAILSCQSAEDLACALKVQDFGYIWLRDEVHDVALFDMEILRGRTVIYEHKAYMELNPAWVCGVILLRDDIPLPPFREKKEWVPEDLTLPDPDEPTLTDEENKADER